MFSKFKVKVFNKNGDKLLESSNLYQYNLDKFIHFTKDLNTSVKLVITNYDENSNDTEYYSSDKEEDENKEEHEYIEKSLFKGMIIKNYGKGYFLKCENTHPDYGKPYYHNAWWFQKSNCWFFKKKYLEYFLERGALMEFT